MNLDKYDYVLMDIIQTYKKENRNELIRLGTIEKTFWLRIEADDSQNVAATQIGERIARLYLSGYILTKNGYTLTKRGREELTSLFAEA